MYQKIVILTGAGISAESGINTFRAQDGLWEQHYIEDVATPEGYARDIHLVEQFYNRRANDLQLPHIEPNAAHLALAKLEQEFEGQVLVVTQNVDNLHERAGNRRLIHMHGELLKARCPQSNQVFVRQDDFGEHVTCTCCIPAQRLRPHIVWFGEMPLAMDKIHQALASCDLFIAIGTSGTVYPAAGFVDIANQSGAQSVEVNLDAANAFSQFQCHLTGKAGQILPELVDTILAQQPIKSAALV
ncbi:Sir2 family NAD+-dependent deacetylase [Shewanella intestini]|uniref:NAD-dependent protein deacylase n=1 Tax=Shewanella intestini TaxID=2017544 RepID=A0ABS5I138_9GAMM|nr:MULTISPECIES: Sir2 family NAD+-dependent deacetylase [Shewanella]MBR9727040.1 NAD-dependent protein deacylase [Shewanella intestini]MRG35841.1 NAD-dependent protein deacylase [Shewanella sp. XMDDZSB0408]